MSVERTTEYRLALLRELCKLPKETEWVEFKHNRAEPEDIGKYISALSNSAALSGKANAYLVWGVDDESHDVVGTSFRPTRERKGAEELENWLVRLLKPRIHFHFLEFESDGKLVSMVEIPRAVHQPVQFQGTEYIRVGSYTKNLKDHSEKERDLWRIFDITPFEQQVAAERMSGSDVLGLLDYPSYFKLLDLPLPESRDGIVARLEDDNMIAMRDDKQWDILNVGALLLANDLDNFRHLARKTVRVIEYEGDGKVVTKREHEEKGGYAARFEELIRILRSLLPENEEMGSALRRSVPMYPDLALRELVANAIIHQDFSMTGTGPMIEIFRGRFEVTNPGEPLMATDRFLDAPPQSRNEGLASFLRRVGICEERGSGIDKVVLQTEVHKLPPPLFEVAEKHTRAVLFAYKPFREMDRMVRIRACYLHACLQFVQRQQMTNSTLRERFGIGDQSRAQVSRVIRDTVEAGFVHPYDSTSGSRKHASYVPYWA